MRTSIILALAVAIALPALAAPDPRRPKHDMSCAYFAANPDDDNGPPITFFANLSPEEESWVTESPGKGRVDLELNRKTLELKWKATFTGLTSPPKAFAIHGPQSPGSEAGALFDLAPKGVKSPIEGSLTLNPGTLAYLVQDRMYVQLSTAKYPMGELRATIQKNRPNCSKK